ncbi:MerR family transcriptional regulator [Streptomyces jumonjinensis]|uniref:MerR family transcriptional regulator n=1 Tax=Streptomyces jumonjinensis TaxID=1945 RepID=UPI0037AE4ACC
MDSTAELLSISAFARRVGLTPSALRFYDDCRVLPPASVDGTTGYRYYTPDQEERAALLRGLRAAGVPLAEVAVVLDGPGSEARTVLERHRERVRERTRAADAAIESVLRSLDGSRTPPAEVTLGGVELASAARQVVPAAGADERYPAVGCVLIEIEDGEIRFVATDRYRLSLRTLRPLAVKGPPGRLLLAAEVLAGLGGWAARAAEVTLEVHPDAARAHGLGEVRELPVSRERFPGYREMLSAPSAAPCWTSANPAGPAAISRRRPGGWRICRRGSTHSGCGCASRAGCAPPVRRIRARRRGIRCPR